MIKRTVYFGNPAYVSLRLDQLEIRLPEVEKSDALPEGFKTSAVKRIPIEDIGVVVLDHRQITISQGALSALLDHQAASLPATNGGCPRGFCFPFRGILPSPNVLAGR